MEPNGKRWHAGLRAKVLAPMILVLVTMLMMMVWFVDFRLRQQIETDAREALRTDDVVFRKLQANHLNYLRLRFQSLGNEPGNRAVFQSLDFNTIQNQLDALLENEGLNQNASTEEGIAFILFTPAEERTRNAPPMIQPATPAAAEFVAAAELNIQRALHPDGETPLTLADTAAVAGKLYNLISVSVETPEHVLIGVLTFGEEVGMVTAQEYSTVTGKPIVLLADARAVTSTLPGRVDAATVESLFRGTNSGVGRMAAGRENYFCASGQFPSLKHDADIGYLLFNSYDPSASALETQQLLLAACLVAIFLGSGMVWFFVSRAMQPLRELRDSAEAVGRGDFSRRVTIRTQDECGELATAFNRMTANVQQSQTELQTTVNTLKATQTQLVQSEKLSAVGEFVAGVAHELNNPLAAVMGFSELLKDAPVEEKHRRHLDLIFKSANRCTKIVQSLLSFARRHQPERKPVAVNRLIEEVLEIVAYQLRTSNVKVACEFAPDLPLVMADGHQIQQVVMNLVNNARQAIEAHQASGRINISTCLDQATIRLRIQDNGPGIKAEHMSRIFDPFFTTKEVGKGTGLGLSLCYGLIKEHGGNIVAASQPGEGAAFTIELPATLGTSAGDGHALVKPDTVPHTEGHGKKVLLVDDEEVLLEMVRDGLQRCGYQVIIAESGEAAQQELQEQRFDAILCDVKMPGMNGRQFYDWLRAARPDMARRFMFMTGDVINQSLQLFLNETHLTCLNKPFVMAELRKSLRQLTSENHEH